MDKDIKTIYKYRFDFSNTKTHFWLQNHNYYNLLWSEKMCCKICCVFYIFYNCIFPKILHSPWNYESLLQFWLSPHSFLIDVTGFQKIFPMRQIYFWENVSIVKFKKTTTKKVHYEVGHNNTCKGRTSGTTVLIFMLLKAQKYFRNNFFPKLVL